MSRGKWRWRRVLAFGALSLVPSAASADNMLTLGVGATVRPGASDVVIPINLASAEELTLLRFDLVLSPALCAQLVSPQAITVRRAGEPCQTPPGRGFRETWIVHREPVDWPAWNGLSFSAPGSSTSRDGSPS